MALGEEAAATNAANSRKDLSIGAQRAKPAAWFYAGRRVLIGPRLYASKTGQGAESQAGTFLLFAARMAPTRCGPAKRPPAGNAHAQRHKAVCGQRNGGAGAK